MHNRDRTYVKRFAVFDEKINISSNETSTQISYDAGDRIELDGQRAFMNENNELLLVIEGKIHKFRKSSFHPEVETFTVKL